MGRKKVVGFSRKREGWKGLDDRNEARRTEIIITAH